MGIRPSGYVTGLVAKSACEGSDKRLCTLDEWKTACRGQNDTLFPYGTDYEDGVCNVNREAHPAALLHGHSSLGHLDPRLNHAAANGSPLFHETAASPRCVSRWGDDGVFDMVGNVDEWVDEGAGAFAGGFYARGSKSGCGALVDNHPASYLDYSTGVRCCKNASP
jgi:formylglycine-generating enzyme required for sulfatase activity